MNELLSFFISQVDGFRRNRVPSLYSDFTLQRKSNPDGFSANTTAWIDALGGAAWAGLLPATVGDRNRLSIETGDHLIRSLETKEWGRPLALGTVIDEAMSRRQMFPYAEYLAARRSIYYRSWAFQPSWLFSWGLRQLGFLENTTSAGTLPSGRFVMMHNIEEAASQIIKKIGSNSSKTDGIYPMALFIDEVAKILNTHQLLTDTDSQILLKYLSRDRSVIIHDAQTVKFIDPHEESTSLSDQDRTIASLKSLISHLNTQIAHLSKRIDVLSERAQTAVRTKNRVSALAALRSRKLNETTLERKSENLIQVEEMYGKIEQATDQATMVRVIEASSAVLRKLNADVGGVTKVEDVLDGLKDEMSKVDEVSGVIEAGAYSDVNIDESAVDDELEEMEKQAKSDREEAEALKTEKRLAGIDGVHIASPAGGSELRKSPKSAEAPVEKGVAALKRLSIQEEAAAEAKNSDDSRATTGKTPDVVAAS